MSVRPGPDAGGGRAGASVSDADLGWRVCAAIIAIAAVVLFVLLVLAPPASPTFDDAKYIGIGENVLAGNGPRTLLGVLFLKHSPVWPVYVARPRSLLGIAPLAIGHLTNAASATPEVALVGVAGWRARPVAGAVGALAVMLLPQTYALARTGGIDFPSIALTFVYLLVGWRVVERGSLRLGVAAGVVYALVRLRKLANP